MVDPLKTARLLLTPLTEAHRAEFIRFHVESLDALARWSPSLTPQTDLNARFDHELDRAEGRAPGVHLKLVGIEHDRVRVIANLNEIVRGPFQSAYAGYAVHSALWGQGYGTEALQGLLDLAFAQPPHGLGLHRVQANIIPLNTGSMKVAERAGMRREGLAERYLNIGGAWQDHAMWARTAEEHTPYFLRTGALGQ